jgi:hypothetical protein
MVLLRGSNYDFSAQQQGDLIADIKSGTNAVSLMSNNGFAVGDYLLIEPYTERAEIVRITALIANTGLTVTVTRNNHRMGNKVYKMNYDQMRFYESSAVNGPYTAILSATVNLDYSDIYTTFNYGAGTDLLFYKRTFYNSSTLAESDIAISDYWQTSDEELLITPQQLRVYLQFDANDYPNEFDMRTLIRLAQDQLSLDAATSDPRIIRIGLYMLAKWYVLRGLATRSISKGYVTVNAEGRTITKAYQELVLEAENTIEEYKTFLTVNLRQEVSMTQPMYHQGINSETLQEFKDNMQGVKNARDFQRGYRYSYGYRRLRYP